MWIDGTCSGLVIISLSVTHVSMAAKNLQDGSIFKKITGTKTRDPEITTHAQINTRLL